MYIIENSKDLHDQTKEVVSLTWILAKTSLLHEYSDSSDRWRFLGQPQPPFSLFWAIENAKKCLWIRVDHVFIVSPRWDTHTYMDHTQLCV